MLALLAEQTDLGGGRRLRIALTAPTGKAAARLEEAVRDEMAGRLSAADTGRLGDLWAVTLHRLLGTRFDSAVALPPRPRTTGCRTTSWSSTRPRWCR